MGKPRPVKVSVFRQCRSGALPSDAAVKKAVARALARAKCGGRTVSVVFCGAKSIVALNRRFLNKNRITDVIAFAYGPVPHGADLPFGDIYVCVPQGEKQAVLYGNSPRRELLTLCVHGALHLSGMYDATPKQRRRMDAAAERVLASAALQRGR